MPQPTPPSATPPLAYAYLALAGDDTVLVPRRPRSHVAGAAVLATVLALAAPLGWGARETSKAAATLAPPKAILAAPAPDDAG